MKMIEFKDVAKACKGKVNALNRINLSIVETAKSWGSGLDSGK
jgi:hypothetical protein